jgi:hypothetical protein
MKTMKVVFGLVLGAFTGALTLRAAQPDALVAHEWGTFTSVADEGGNPVVWAPWLGPSDLPCFVERMDGKNWKVLLSSLVRMETPVLYFYSTRPVTLSVQVDFPQGWITEWYPKAAVSVGSQYPKGAAIEKYNDGQIIWNSVNVLPGADLEFPTSNGESHYFYARNTDSAPLRVGDQQEKLLFYRGIGGFQVPVRPKFSSDGKMEIRNAGKDPIPLAIVFENRTGKIGYRVVRNIRDIATVDAPEMTGDFQQLRQDLAGELAEFGLYKKEAEAMVETWRDSWFEDGTRVLYIYPRAQVDALLPLAINPKPASTGRVFVGRVEVLSPWTQQTIRTAISAGDVATLTKFGRFLDPFIQQIRRTDPDAAETLRVSALLLKARQEIQKSSSSTSGWNSGSCVE